MKTLYAGPPEWIEAFIDNVIGVAEIKACYTRVNQGASRNLVRAALAPRKLQFREDWTRQNLFAAARTADRHRYELDWEDA